MKSSSPLLRFNAWFGQREELKLLNCLCTDAIDTLMGHLKSKPALDSAMGSYYLDAKELDVEHRSVVSTSADAKEAQTENILHYQVHST